MLTTTCSLGVAPSASRGARLSSRRGAFASREAASLARTRQSREVVRAPGVARAMADDDESLLRKLNPFKAIKKQQEKAAIEKRREEANKVISDEFLVLHIVAGSLFWRQHHWQPSQPGPGPA